MTTTRAQTPRDLEARERLLHAQQAEATAVADVYRADAALAKVQAKHGATVAAAAAAVDHARADVTDARAVLVGVSGRQRAAQLLGRKQAEMPKQGSLAQAKRGK